MCPIKKHALVLVLFCTAVFQCGNGGLILYVRPDDSKTCPPDIEPRVCRSLEEYFTEYHNLKLHTNTTFAFLPGYHILSTYIRLDSDLNVRYLTLQASNQEQGASIAGTRGGGFSFYGFTMVQLKSLELFGCEFDSNYSGFGIMDVFDTSQLVIENCTFTNNTGPLVYASDAEVYLIDSKITWNRGSWLFLQECSATLINNVVIGNTADQGAGLINYLGLLSLMGTNLFSENSGFYGGVIYAYYGLVEIGGNASFLNNGGELGGAMTVVHCDLVTISSQRLVFFGNHGISGGAIHSIASNISFVNEVNATFAYNSGTSGGAVYLASESTLNFNGLCPPLVKFVNNSAVRKGGAVYIQDMYPLSYCIADTNDPLEIFGPECSFQITVNSIHFTDFRKTIIFTDNIAGEGGNAVFGGALDICHSGLVASSTQMFNGITNISDYNTSDDTTSAISSQAYKVCACEDNMPKCVDSHVSHSVYSGATLNVTAIALGQRNGRTSATILAIPNGLIIEQQETYQAITNKCSTLRYTVSANPGYASLSLIAAGSCHTRGKVLTIRLEVLQCPPGFEGNTTCVCDPRLLKYVSECNVQHGTVLRLHDDQFWVGYSQTSEIIVSPTCPFDYCISKALNFKINNSDSQCQNHRSGLLCGKCSEGLSLLLGSSSCVKCSDDYLSLFLIFAVAGVILVAFLLLFNLTVAIGTINGLIFYANIVTANETLVFPNKSNMYLDILKVFVAWISLDFGIKSCFYDGMDQYAKTWLQYAFPVYIWTLIGLLFLISHFSIRASRALGSNPVAVLATLFLLSYTKILSTIIEAFSPATLGYPQNKSKVVWLYDGNVPFLDISDGRHLALFLASVLCLFILFIPYTLLLLTSQWLQIKSHWKILSWLNQPKLRSFLDAYHAPYKSRHRYWTGLLLVLRLAILTTSALTRGTGENRYFVFQVIQIFVIVVQMWGWSNGGVYNKWYLNTLEAFFFLNLGLLVSSIQYIESDLSSDVSAHTATTSTLITIAFIAFTGIVIFHIFLKIEGREDIRFLVHIRQAIIVRLGLVPQPPVEQAPTRNRGEATRSFIALRESLLDSQI